MPPEKQQRRLVFLPGLLLFWLSSRQFFLMNYTRLIRSFTLLSLFFLSPGCRQPSLPRGEDDPVISGIRPYGTADTSPKPGRPVIQLEDFENPAPAKSSYAAGAVQLSTGGWTFSDALIGSTGSDAKNGQSSVRIRNNGKIRTNFEVRCRQLRILHGAYGKDADSSWELWVSTDGGRAYRRIGERLQTAGHELHAATFEMPAGSLSLEIRKTGGGKSRLNIDDMAFGEKPLAAAGNASPQIAPNSGKEVQQAAALQMLLGNPSGATSTGTQPDNFLVDRGYYIMSYNRQKAIPNWVSWHIGSSDLGNADRMNNFRPDGQLPAGWYQADNTSYRGSGFDKGHNCPSGDRSSSTTANSATFLMSNIIPQAPNNNQHTWEHLESYCRAKVRQGNEVYVIMGNYGTGGTGKNGNASTIDNGRISVPSRIWKIAVIIPEGENDLQRINAGTTVIAVDTPNDNEIFPNWMDYVCTVSALEKATGYHFFSALPQAVREKIAAQKFKGGN